MRGKAFKLLYVQKFLGVDPLMLGLYRFNVLIYVQLLTVERVKSATTTLRRVLVSPSFLDFFSENGPPYMMDEDANMSICLKLSLTVWDFVLPVTP
ncbi:hypothetical protein CTI12_AA443470 [Artemisia annua]|uniref:Uncharacterized protein n=1 Tax=Artemisia annua TaxID=35608 RepID=A0A2U1LX87_ARTAN|nr:hypothetical protein CTI12_AA443470 [Artemisia annua]